MEGGQKAEENPRPIRGLRICANKGRQMIRLRKGPKKRATQSRGCERGAKRGAQSKGLRPCHVIRRQKDAQSEGFRQLGYGLYSGKFSVSYSRRMLEKETEGGTRGRVMKERETIGGGGGKYAMMHY